MEWNFLAGLRFLLAWIVFCYHLSWFVPDSDLLVKFSKLGSLSAVIGFLLVSGYSIANSISKKQEGFYKRRILRIYPLYATAILVSLVPFLLAGKSEILISETTWKQPHLLDTLGNLFFLQGFLVSPIPSNVIVWTLSLEVFCYLLAPIFLKIGNQKNLILIGISGLIWAAYPHFNLPYFAFLSYGANVFLFLWAWLLGFWYYQNRDKKYSGLVIVLLGCVLLTVNNMYNEKLSLLTYLISSLLLVYSPRLTLPNSALKILRYLGDISYPLYLFHLPILIVSTAVLGISNSFSFALLCLMGSMFFYHALDVYRVHRAQSYKSAKEFQQS